MKNALRVAVAFALAAQLLVPETHALECSPELLGKLSCHSNITVQCTRRYDLTINAFRYQWEFVNSFNQVFDAKPALLGKTEGYTPKPCTSGITTKGTHRAK